MRLSVRYRPHRRPPRWSAALRLALLALLALVGALSGMGLRAAWAAEAPRRSTGLWLAPPRGEPVGERSGHNGPIMPLPGHWAATPPNPQISARRECLPGGQVNAFFWQAVLVYMGAIPTPFAVDALAQWQAVVKSPYCWNPLGVGWRVVSHGALRLSARNFPDYFSGVRATAETLLLPAYAPLQRMLRQEDFDEEGLQQAVARWFYGRAGVCDERCQDLVDTWKRLWQEHGISVLCPPLACDVGAQVGAAFYDEVFRQVGIPTTEFAVEALQAWAAQEGARACWNPLATLWEVPEKSCTYNAVGVQHYLSASVGAYATARTLALPAYEPLRRFLRGETWDQRGLEAAVGLWVNGDPRTCRDPGYAGYCARLFDRWWALWQERDRLSYNPLLTTPTPTPEGKP